MIDFRSLLRLKDLGCRKLPNYTWICPECGLLIKDGIWHFFKNEKGGYSAHAKAGYEHLYKGLLKDMQPQQTHRKAGP